MRVLSVIFATGLLAASGFAQSTADYLKLRSEQHIVQPTPGDRLATIIGPSIVEIAGRVQGSFKAGNNMSYMVKLDNGEDLSVICDTNAPEWMQNGEVPVRMLLHVDRPARYDNLEAHLMLAAPEADISKVDEAYWKAEAAKAQAKADQMKASRPANFASRGEVGGAGGDMYGWIGGSRRGHREYTSSSSIQTAYRQFILGRNHRLTYDAADKIARSVIGFCQRYSVDARLVMAVIIAESDFHPMSTSRTGAKGLGQLMDGTAAWMGVSNPYDIEQNIYGMIKLLRTHMDEYHVFQYPVKSQAYYDAIGLVLAAYNAGDGAVKRYGGIPPYRETQNYVVKVIETFRSLTRDD